MTNPYNISKPLNLFVGLERQRRDIYDGLRNGKSFAVLGGRRCGKTSLLMKLEEELDRQPVPHFNVLPRRLAMQAVTPRSTAEFFGAVYGALTESVPDSQPWDVGEGTSPYQRFLELIDGVAPALSAAGGTDWLAVVLVDELEVATQSLPDSIAFQNLRNLLMESRWSSHFRLIASGVTTMADLVEDAGSPLNNLDPVYLGPLDLDSAKELVRAGHATMPEPRCAEFLELSGRHPYILQGLLEYTWEDRDTLDGDVFARATRRFVRDRNGSFKSWVRHFGETGRSVFHALATTGSYTPGRDVDQALQTLGYHGVIDESDPINPRVSSTLFRDWFLENAGFVDEAPEPLDAPPAKDAKNVFLVHGRNEALRAAMTTFLRALGLRPLEWSAIVEATGNAAPHIFEILETGFSIAQAAVVLLTPDDEARLRDEFHKTTDPPYEKDLTPQPRPNVIFEAGIAMSRFPRSTVLVQFGFVRPFTDIAGMHVIEMDGSYAKRKELRGRLQTAGCEVDDNTLWQTEGDFSLE